MGLPKGSRYTLVLAQPDYRQQASLSEIEKGLLDFIFNFIFDEVEGNKITFKNLKRHFKIHRRSFYTRFKKFKKLGFKQALKEGLFERASFEFSQKHGFFLSLGLGIVAFVFSIFALVLLLGAGQEGSPFSILIILSGLLIVLNSIGAFILTPIWLILTAYVQKRSEKGSREAASWKAFKKYLKEYSVTKKYPIDSVILWGKYLVYGTLLGVVC